MNLKLTFILPIYWTCLVWAHQSKKGGRKGGGGGFEHEDFSKLASDIEHITEHLKEQIDLNKEMTPEELEFYYFMEHDFNNDTKLDGLEIFSAIKHSDLANDLKVDVTNLSPEQARRAYETEINNYADIIDEIMKEDDFNNDGYLSYLEYVMARRRDAREQQHANSNPRKNNN